MKKILVPTDFSDCAYEATRVAAEIAKKTQATLYLLHIIDIPVTMNQAGVGLVHEDVPESIAMMKLAHLNFEKLLKDPILKDVVRIIEAVDFDSTYEKITKRAKEHGIDLIVMGSHGSKGLKEFFIGSNTERVASFAPCPVLTVKSKPKEIKFDNIVFASDFTEEADEAFHQISELIKLFNTKIHLLKVITPVNFESTSMAKNAMESFAKRHNLTNYTVNTYNDTSEESGMQHFANDVNADAIALATHGRSGLGQLFRGNVTADLVNHSDKMVLSYRINKK